MSVADDLLAELKRSAHRITESRDQVRFFQRRMIDMEARLKKADKLAEALKQITKGLSDQEDKRAFIRGWEVKQAREALREWTKEIT